MKLAYTICSSETSGKFLAYRDDLEKMFFSLREIGYQGIEPFVRDPRAMDQEYFCRVLERSGLEVAAIGTGPLAAEDKLTFTSSEESVRSEAIERTKAVIDFAARFGAQVNIGKLRGDLYKGNPLRAREWMKEAFITVCEYASTQNIMITLEPQCRFSVDNLKSTQEGIAWLKELQLPNLFIMLDLFHMNIEDKSISASLIEAKPYTKHVHFADNNRGVPGMGSINFPEILRILKSLEYEHYISMEIEQFPDCYSAAKASFDYVDRLMKEA